MKYEMGIATGGAAQHPVFYCLQIYLNFRVLDQAMGRRQMYYFVLKCTKYEIYEQHNW